MAPSAHELLRLDSELFGFKVAKLDASKLDANTLPQYLETLAKKQVRLVFSKIAVLDNAMMQAARAASGKWMGDVVEMESDLSHIKALDASKAPGLTLELATSIDLFEQQTLSALASRLTIHSHLGLDAKLDQRAVLKMFETWITNSFNHQAADEVLVAKLNAKPVGFISFFDHTNARIELLVVNKSAEGQHVASSLLDKVLAILKARGFSKAQLATQINNAAALRLYVSRGFKEVQRLSTFHFWLS